MLTGRLVNDQGAAVGDALRYDSGFEEGRRAIYVTGGGATGELAALGFDPWGTTESTATAINGGGVVVGTARKYVGGDTLGDRAVRWDHTGSSPVELGTLGDNAGYTNSTAYDVNDAGDVVGYSTKYASGVSQGTRAVRWAAGSTTATELGHLGTSATGTTYAEALAVNGTGTSIGFAEKYVAGSYVGERAVRWDASSASATELGTLGVPSWGETYAKAYSVNDAGAAVGYSDLYDGDNYLGYRAVRWAAGSTQATALDVLSTDATGYADANANAINGSGVTVGWSDRYDAEGNYLGFRAARWDATGTSVLELAGLGADADGYAESVAYDVNSSGYSVGWADAYAADEYLGMRAVLWDALGVATDLNTLIDPLSGWTLTEAVAISDTGWITGIGTFDPDGAGIAAAYQRQFLVHVDGAFSVIPEPAALSLVVVGMALLWRRPR
jgi:hypothetical protein